MGTDARRTVSRRTWKEALERERERERERKWRHRIFPPYFSLTHSLYYTLSLSLIHLSLPIYTYVCRPTYFSSSIVLPVCLSIYIFLVYLSIFYRFINLFISTYRSTYISHTQSERSHSLQLLSIFHANYLTPDTLSRYHCTYTQTDRQTFKTCFPIPNVFVTTRKIIQIILHLWHLLINNT